MGIVDRLRSITNWRGKVQPPNPMSSDYGGAYVVGPDGFPISVPYLPIDLHLQPYEEQQVSAAWACMAAITDAIATSPWQVYQRDVNGQRVVMPDHQLSYLLNTRPNEECTAQAFKEGLVFQALTYGNAYAEIVTDGAGRVVELHGLISRRMVVTRDSKTRELVYNYGSDHGMVTLRPYQVLHLRSMSIDGLMGRATVAVALCVIATALAQDKFAGHFYSQGCNPSGVIVSQKKIEKKVRDRLVEYWRTKWSGGRNHHKVPVLEDGLDYKKIGSTAEEAMVIPARQFSVEEIARYFKVPPHKIGVAASAQGYGRNLTEINESWVRDCLLPWSKRFAEEATYKCLPQRSPWPEAAIDLSWLTVPGAKERAETDEIRIRSGVYSVNEVRDREHLQHIGPSGDLHLVQGTLVVLDPENLKKQAPAQLAASNDNGPGGAGPGGGDSAEDEEKEAEKAASQESELEGEPDRAQEAAEDVMNAFVRRSRARRADLARNGKTLEEIEANLAGLRARSVTELTALGVNATAAKIAIESLEFCSVQQALKGIRVAA